MVEETGFWRSYGIPIAVAVVAFAGLNALSNNPTIGFYRIIPQSLVAFLSSSVLALWLIRQAIRGGRFTRRDAGLAITGWTAPKRLLGLVVILLFGYGGFATIEPAANEASSARSSPAEKADTDVVGQSSPTADDPAARKPAWGDFCFWFVFLLPASQTELLVFVGVGFCLAEAFLRGRAWHPLLAMGLAAVFASVGFGLFHYSYPPVFWSLVFFPLMPIMFINICFFVITRNFYLTLFLHNAFAAVGFTGMQYATYPPDPLTDPAIYQNAKELLPVFVAFVVPFLLLHWLEASGSSTQHGSQD